MKARPPISPAEAEKQLAGFISKFDPKNQKVLRAARRILQRRFPTAIEKVYDNYNFFVIGYCSTERSSDCVVSLVAAANGVGLSFYYGASLPDPHKLLQGSGNQNRFIRLPSAEVLREPSVRELINAAEAHARTPMPVSGRGRLLIHLIAKRQRPRRTARGRTKKGEIHAPPRGSA